MMRILHVHDHAYFQGGVEQILFDTARGLSDQGCPQALLHSGDATDPEFTRPFHSTANVVSIIDSFKPNAVLIHKVANPQRVAAVAQSVPAAHMVHDYDLVCPRRHKYFPLSLSVCNRPAGISCYLHMCCFQRAADDALLPIRIKGTAQVKRQLKAVQNVRRFIVGSRYMKKELETNGISGGKIVIIHPVPAALKAPVAHPPSEAPEVLFVGQVIRGKGVDLMLKALSCLNGEWRASIVGEGNHLDACKSLAKQLDISARVNFTGWIQHHELDRYYSSARLLVVPSRWPEPFGMVGIEAMARGRPVVAFGVGGIPDWLDHASTGFLVPPADIPAMTSAIQRLLDDPSLAGEMGRAGVLHTQRAFSHQAYLDQIKQQMEQLK